MGETAEPRILLSGLAIGESPRWHEGRLWFSNWGTQEIIAIDLEGNSEVMLRVPTTIPFHQAVFGHAVFRGGRATTTFLVDHPEVLAGLAPGAQVSPPV